MLSPDTLTALLKERGLWQRRRRHGRHRQRRDESRPTQLLALGGFHPAISWIAQALFATMIFPMPLEILDYQTPDKRTAPRWKRRYLIFAPLIGGGYLCLANTVLFAASVTYLRWAPRFLPRAVDALFAIVDFPMLRVIDPGKNMALAIAMGLLDSVIWGFCTVGIWHAISSLRKRRQ